MSAFVDAEFARVTQRPDRSGELNTTMTNTLGAYNPTFYAAEGLIWLRKALGLATRVNMGFDADRRTFGKGDTITIRRPGLFTAQAAPSTAQDINTESVSVPLTGWWEVKYPLSDKEYAYTQERIITEHIQPAAYAIADKIDQDLASLAVTVPHAFIEPTAGTAATIAGILGTQQKMFDNKVPMNNPNMMHLMVGGKEQADLLALSAFAQWQGAGNVGAQTQQTGVLGQRYGFNIFANQNRPTVAYADITDFAGEINNASGYAKGSTSIAVDALGTVEVYKKGTIIKITLGTDLGSEYALTADATMSSGGATITINPPLRNAVVDNDTFSIVAGQDLTSSALNNVNLAFHKDWATLAFARLPDFTNFPNQLGISCASIQDPVTGLALRYRVFYEGQNSKLFAAVDALWGFKELNADLACRYEIKNT